jgi:hypothetical protein
VKNYQWSAREDGGYDCQTTVISTGEIIESLKINYIKPDLAKYHLYETESIGKGLLDDLFSKQGNNKSTDFASHYEKNILAGTWAELSMKQKDPNASYTSTADIRWASIKMPGLKGNGDLTSMVQPGSDYQEYITLKSVFKILNEYIIGKDASGEPLIKLSTRHNDYDGSTVAGSNLLCVAHPLQISTDPSICVIKNPLWDELMTDIAASAAPVLNNIQTKADDIVKKLIAASGASSDSTNEDDFLTSIKEITDGSILSSVEQIFTSGKYFGAGSLDGKDTFATDGLAGLITREFTSGAGRGNTWKGGSANQDDRVISISSNQYLVPSEIVNMYYLYRMKEHFKSVLSVDLKVNLKVGADYDIDNTISTLPTGKTNLSKDTPLTLNDFLSGVTTFPTADRDQGPVDMAKLVDKKTTVNTAQVPPTARYYGYYSVVGVEKITPSVASATVASIVFSAADAKAMIAEINKACLEDFFTSQYSEIGILANIYVNLDFLYKLATSVQMESQDSKEKNEINVYNYVKNLIVGINGALGNVANLEIHVDPIDSIGRVIDINYTDPDKTTKDKLFNLQVQNTKSVVRSYTLESKIFPNQSAIIAIGSQAKGGQLGMQNNTMVDFNKNITDRVISNKADNETASNGNSTSSPIVANSLAGIITLYALCHQEPIGGSAYADTVSKCKNALRDIIAYLQSLFESSGSNRNIIPTKFSFTMDGIGGLVIGQLFRINDDILPKGYRGIDAGSTLAQTITGISHKVGNSDWTTTIDALNVILDKRAGSLSGSKDIFKKIINDIIKLAIDRANSIPRAAPNVGVMGGAGSNVGQNIPPGGTVEDIKGKPATCFYCNKPHLDDSCLPQTWTLAWTTEQAKTVTIKPTSYIPPLITSEYIPTFKTLSIKNRIGGLVVAMIAAAINEGWHDPTTRAYTQHNPGNVGVQTNLKKYNPQPDLKTGMALQWNALFAFAYERSGESDWRTSIYRKDTTLIELCWHIAPWYDDFYAEKKFCRSNDPAYQNDPIGYAKNIAAYYHHYGATSVNLLTTLDQLKNISVSI